MKQGTFQGFVLFQAGSWYKKLKWLPQYEVLGLFWLTPMAFGLIWPHRGLPKWPGMCML
jgi:hypothetical protein